ncbi:MAG: imidazole glycerol phosphate synthase subunit HisH [Candidatus Omnitrophota bacterium]|nr:MAG: imidazole glycerol phosphate synthase subunit HisH [Candidatus Omnitrophota bacterium]
MIVIVDYGMGNLRSVQKAVEYLGVSVRLSDSPGMIQKATKLIFPGVGHFGKAAQELKKRKIFKLLQERIYEGIPFFGICLGMQLLLEESEEAEGIKGLGIIKGRVRRFRGRLIVPHMGWNSVKFQNPKSKIKNNLFRGVRPNSYFYFAHSYYCVPRQRDVVLATTHYSREFVSAFHKKNIWAIQFHPEKSQNLGLRLLNNFLTLC